MWNTRGLKGSTFEELINMTNEMYRRKELAMVQKIPTPITPIQVDNKKKRITLAFFDQKSTVDYIGAVQGIPICFDAKETSLKSLPIQNVHEHQMQFMRDFEKQGGIAFLIVHFSFCREMYFLEFQQLERYWKLSRNGGRKSIPYDDFNKELLIESKSGFFVHYLTALQVVLEKEMSLS